MNSGVEIDTDADFPSVIACVDNEYVMTGLTHPAFILNGVDQLRLSVRYKSAVNGEWTLMPEVNIAATEAASYLAHISKLVLAANGVHNGPHNKLTQP